MKRNILYENIRTKQPLNRVTAPSMPFEWSINPYRGCQHGCSFCYARSTHSFLGMETDDTFQNHILMKSNAADALSAQLQRMARSRGGLQRIGRVAIGTATDPYQPAEANEKLTRQCLELLAEYGVPVSITTRSPLILRDIDLLKRARIISVNISIHTMNSGVWKAMEPSTPSPAKRMETLLRLAEEGIPAGVFMAPILPLLTDNAKDMEAVVAAAAEHLARFVMPSFLRLSTAPVKAWYFGALEAYDPSLPAKVAELYRHSAYAPKSYREPVSDAIRALLKTYGIPDWASEPISRPQSEKRERAPEQISFSF